MATIRNFPISPGSAGRTHELWDGRIGSRGAEWLVRYSTTYARFILGVVAAVAIGMLGILVDPLQGPATFVGVALGALSVWNGALSVRAMHMAGRSAGEHLGGVDADGRRLIPPVMTGPDYFDRWLSKQSLRTDSRGESPG